MYFKLWNKFLFPLKIMNICACVRDLGNMELHCSFFLHRDVHFLYDNKTATSNSRRNSSLKFVENEIPAMERFSFVTYQYASNRMNATYQRFMPKRGRSANSQKRFYAKEACKRQDELLVFITPGVCDQTLPLPRLCKRIRLWVCFFCVSVFVFFFSKPYWGIMGSGSPVCDTAAWLALREHRINLWFMLN